MFFAFSCPSCHIEIEVDETGAGSEIKCPNCGADLVIPAPTPEALAAGAAAEAAAAEQAAVTEESGKEDSPSANPMSSSAAMKEEKHFVVPTREGPSVPLIRKASRPLEVAAKDTDRVFRVKTVRRSDCVEVDRDKFDEVVTDLLQKIGEKHIIAVHPLSYSRVESGSGKVLHDYGVLIVFRG